MNPFELADYAAFVVAAGVAFLAGRGVGRRHVPKPAAPPDAVCSCTHGYGAHDEGSGCQGSVRRPTKWGRDKWGDTEPVSWEHVPCPCRRYDGPDPQVVNMMRGGAL